jgi:regulator of protease activity HflC (stomatin/prohibitin superfamily)
MNLSSLLGLIALVGFVVAGLGVVLMVTNAAGPQNQRKSGGPAGALIVIGAIVGVLFFVASSGLILVGATQVAVIFQSVGGDPATNSLWSTPLKSGVHIIAPIINEPFYYSTEIRNYTMSKTANEGAQGGDDSVAVRTKDGQQVYIDVSLLYRVDPDKANQVHLRFRERYEMDFVRPTVRASVRDVISGYVVEDILGEKRNEIQIKLHEVNVAKFSEVGLELRELLLRNITFSDEYIQAVEQKQVAQQQVEQAKQEAERARTLAKGQADASVTAAKGEADAVVARAQGDAQAIELRAAADAKALALISEQLNKNPLLIQWRYIEKLAQNVSLILLPNNGTFLFDPTRLADQGATPPTQATPRATPTQ